LAICRSLAQTARRSRLRSPRSPPATIRSGNERGALVFQDHGAATEHAGWNFEPVYFVFVDGIGQILIYINAPFDEGGSDEIELSAADRARAANGSPAVWRCAKSHARPS
jgi:hypothetical protein